MKKSTVCFIITLAAAFIGSAACTANGWYCHEEYIEEHKFEI